MMFNLINFSTILEVIIRTFIVFFFTYILMRIRGKKQLMTLSIFDIIIIVSLGSALGDAMIYSEDVIPLYKSLTAITTAILLVWVIENITAKLPPKLFRLIEGEEDVLIRDGVVYEKILDKVNINKEELKSKLREKDVDDFKDVKLAILERDGSLTVKKK